MAAASPKDLAAISGQARRSAAGDGEEYGLTLRLSPPEAMHVRLGRPCELHGQGGHADRNSLCEWWAPLAQAKAAHYLLI
jgi:hypothetical protein